MIEKLQAHYGCSRMPFGRDLAPGMLHRHASHNEAVARITWCISERSIGMDQDSPPSCLLVGQPTLRRTMKLAVLAALEQRTALRYTMPGMTATETASHIKHHLGLAGRSDQLFTDDAVTLIHTTSRGFPRAVNNLCLQSLVATFAAGKSLVDEKAAQSAVTEVLD
ncbi:hypothetical protein [Streptomyces sp. NPDC093089]|uniref:hypothetical protein n=1 Tax=Streptomyces sp. NPDC093089 TaxID=3366024 RepID=UPI003803675D